MSARRAATATPPDAPATPDIRDIAARLRLSATRLARQLRRQSDTGLTPSQLSALATIERHGPLTLGELADRERVAPPSITRVVAKLEEHALVRRDVDAADRRVSRLVLTRSAVSLLAESRTRRNQWLAARIATLGADDVAKLAAALDVLDALASSPPDGGST